MRKLKLELDALSVESFTVEETGGRSGTVHGHLLYTDPRVCATDEEGCYAQTYAASNCATCGQTCQGSCPGQQTCDPYGSCDPWACSQTITSYCNC